MDDNKRKIIAGTVALLLHVAVALLLVLCYLHYPPTDEPLPEPAQQTDITFGGEFVALGNVDVPAANDQPASSQSVDDNTSADADELADHGPAGEGTALASSTNESPMQTKPKASGPTKEQLEEEARRTEAKREQERKQNESNRINSDIQNAFKGSGSGQSGSPNGNASTGALKGQPGHTLGPGYTLASWGKPSSGYDGEIVIKVRVNSLGQVIEATYLRGTGAAAANRQVRRSCEQASLSSRFSVPKNATGDKVGTIIWRFE